MNRVALGLAVLLGTVTLAGCLTPFEGGPIDCDVLTVSTFAPPIDADGHIRASGEPFPLMVWTRNEAGAKIGLSLETEPESFVIGNHGRQDFGDNDPTSHVSEAGETHFVPFGLNATRTDETVTLRADSSGTVNAKRLLCSHDRRVTQHLTIGTADPTERAQAGQGVLVHTVGVWENGTSFYTNLDRYHNRTDLPRSYQDYAGGDPLKVYVYDESPDEMPERYNESGYVTTIPGFNEALKGIPTTSARIAYLPPEEAYTREGYEAHPLYGDSLVFYIEALEVREIPCDVPEPVCELPGTDDVPLPPRGLAPVSLSS